MFDTATGTFEAIDISAQVSADPGWFKGGALAPNGKVVFTPSSEPAVGIFDPASKTLELVDRSSTYKFAGAALAPDGTVVFAPDGQTHAGVFDPATSTFDAIDLSEPLSAAGVSHGNPVFAEAVTMPSGEVIFVPHGANHVGILFSTTTTTTSTTDMPTTDMPTTSMLRLKLKLKVKGKTKAWLKLKVANGHVNATAKVSSRRRRG